MSHVQVHNGCSPHAPATVVLYFSASFVFLLLCALENMADHASCLVYWMATVTYWYWFSYKAKCSNGWGCSVSLCLVTFFQFVYKRDAKARKQGAFCKFLKAESWYSAHQSWIITRNIVAWTFTMCWVRKEGIWRYNWTRGDRGRWYGRRLKQARVLLILQRVSQICD